MDCFVDVVCRAEMVNDLSAVTAERNLAMAAGSHATIIM